MIVMVHSLQADVVRLVMALLRKIQVATHLFHHPLVYLVVEE
jgi:hypothetical protein